MADTGIAIENRDKILNQARTINIYGQHNHDSSKPDTASELRAEQEKYHAGNLPPNLSNHSLPSLLIEPSL